MSEKPVLHGVNASPFVRKARVALAEKGIEYETVPVMPMGQPAEYYEISPLGKIPCYVEGDFALPDSSVIIAYLERKQSEPRLYPETPASLPARSGTRSSPTRASPTTSVASSSTGS